MKTIRSIILIAALTWVAVQESNAQFKFSGEFRPRTEFSHGYGSLAADDQKVSLFTSQRTRLNTSCRSATSTGQARQNSMSSACIFGMIRQSGQAIRRAVTAITEAGIRRRHVITCYRLPRKRTESQRFLKSFLSSAIQATA